MTNHDESKHLAVIVCTFNRHDTLRKTLASMARLTPGRDISFSVVVVDNSEDSNALPLIDEISQTVPYELWAIPAHPPNISIARNAGVAATRSEYVAFIDDDQELDPNWLVALEQALTGSCKDVFFGAVEPVYEAPDRVDDTVDLVFSRRVNGASGTELFAMGPNKTPGVALGCGNAILRRSTTLTDPIPFDPDFGNGGGEDYDLFCRLQRRGCRFAWVAEAGVREFVPAGRCDPVYMASRLFAGGQAFAMAVSRNSSNPRFERIRQRLIAVVQLSLLLPRLALLPFSGNTAKIAFRYRKASALGKLAFRPLKPIYLAPPVSAGR